jgi:hypothetical protein
VVDSIIHDGIRVRRSVYGETITSADQVAPPAQAKGHTGSSTFDREPTDKKTAAGRARATKALAQADLYGTEKK